MLRKIGINFIGKFWNAISTIIFIPYYIDFLGFEKYSVITFFIILLNIFIIFDAGSTSLIIKEFANPKNSKTEKKDIFITFETLLLIISILIIIFFVLFSSRISDQFIDIGNGGKNLDVSISMLILGINIPIQLLSNYYLGGLIGLEQHFLSNKYLIVQSTLKNLLIFIPLFFSQTLIAFFLWQGLVMLSINLFARHSIFKTLNIEKKKRFSVLKFSKSHFNKNRSFLLGMFLISFVAIINTQLDKLTISKLFPITELGYYNLAITISQSLILLISPVAQALLPKITELFSNRDISEASKYFIKLFKTVNIIIITVSMVLIFYSFDILYYWTQNETIADKSNEYLPILALGSAFLAMQILPFNLAIANNHTRTNNLIGLFSLFVSIPIYIIAINNYGPMGAAISWLILQLLTTPIYVYLIKSKFITDTPFRHLILDLILKPLAFSFLISLLFTYTSSSLDSLFFVCLKVIILAIILLVSNLLLFYKRKETLELKEIVMNIFKFKNERIE